MSITAIIPTYNRKKELFETVNRLRCYVVYDGELNILVGDDSNDPQTRAAVKMLDQAADVTVIDGPQKGLADNLNNLLKHVKTELVLQLDDDHWLEQELDLNQYAEDLLKLSFNLGIGWLRLFMGERHDIYSLGTYYQFFAHNRGPYWVLDHEAPELYLASNRPHLKRLDFHKHFGWYRTGSKLGETENAFCHQYKELKASFPGYPSVAIPMFGLKIGQWRHVGESWQKQGL